MGSEDGIKEDAWCIGPLQARQGHVIHGDNLLNWRELLFQLNQENPNHQDPNLKVTTHVVGLKVFRLKAEGTETPN